PRRGCPGGWPRATPGRPSAAARPPRRRGTTADLGRRARGRYGAAPKPPRRAPKERPKTPRPRTRMPGTGSHCGWRRPASSVLGAAGVDVLDPAEDAAADVHRVGEALVLHHGERLGAAPAGLAVQHDL